MRRLTNLKLSKNVHYLKYRDVKVQSLLEKFNEFTTVNIDFPGLTEIAKISNHLES